MARSIEYWYNLIITEKETKTSLTSLTPANDNYNDYLTALNSNSKVSVWRKIVFLFAYAAWYLDTLFDDYKKEVKAITSVAVYGHNEWWVDQAKKFQYGDDLQIININGVKVIDYAIMDPTKQIIKLASITEGGNGSSVLKVATLSGSNVVQLSSVQLDAFRTYVEKKQPAGTNITVSSDSTDLAKYYFSVYYNPLLPLATIKANVEASINNYHAKIGFDGSVVLNGNIAQPGLIDYIQAVSGVTDVVLIQAWAKSNNGTYATILKSYPTKSGFISIDPAFPLSATINYVGQ